MDRTDPDNFDSIEHEHRTTVRGLEVEHFPKNNAWSPGHEFRLGFDVGPNTRQTIHANAAELRRWSRILAEAALRFGEAPPGALPDDSPECPACGGDVHIDLSGAVWTANSRTEDER